LYVVATPIGNLADWSYRAHHIVASVDAIAAEDTRNSSTLLKHYGIHKTLFALHDHNEGEAADKLVALLRQGQSVALVSDAGTPCVSDPGARAVARVREAGFRVIPIAGANAAITAFSASGLSGAFTFIGFLPPKREARRSALAGWAAHGPHLLMYEAPHRLEECLQDLADTLGPARRIVIARELTKRFEQIQVCSLGEAVAWLNRDPNHGRGEFVLLAEGAGPPKPPAEDAHDKLLLRLLADLPLKSAVALAVELTGASRNTLYQRALGLRRESGEA
jgi:16S rRNA (cytidine1402-2'-O)-methyltransferase